jgi:hypothetical protein
MRSRREHWPIPSRVEERARLLQASLASLQRQQSEAAQERRNGNEEAIEALAETWIQKAERHRALAFDLAHNSLKAAAKAPPPAESWRDIDLCDKVARRNAGLEDSERNQNINVNMQLIEARLLSINLPKDAAQSPL